MAYVKVTKKKLRSKMGEQGNYIKTIWGMGYKFDVDTQP